MTITNDTELRDAEAKLVQLRERFQTTLQGTGDEPELRDVTLRGLQQFLNQLTIEISRYHVIQLARKKVPSAASAEEQSP